MNSFGFLLLRISLYSIVAMTVVLPFEITVLTSTASAQTEIIPDTQIAPIDVADSGDSSNPDLAESPAEIPPEVTQPYIPQERLAAIFSGQQDPEGALDLRAIEAHVKKIVERTTPMTVGLIIGDAAGSGVIITSDGYVLTAGHVSMKPGLDAKVILPDGTLLNAKTLGINNAMDSGLLKITDQGPWPYLEMGTSANLVKGQWIVALGHPGGYEIGRLPVLRLGRILSASDRIIRTDCVLIGGDSGGPLINMQGQVIGIHSRINEKVTSNYHVPIDSYSETWDRLVSGEIWGGGLALGRSMPYLGFKLNENDMTIREVTAKSPAERAGIIAGDLIHKLAGRPVENRSALRTVMFGLTPGEKIEVVVIRGQAEVNLELIVGVRPR